jgi:2-polyprenyl-6-methoxyphenol hydroxylase-like FAD-dependent oxidoreductase
MIETNVLIAGGGPVGLTLAMDLAGRSVDVTVLELRAPGEPPAVKCNQISARSMEIFRRIGVAGKLRAAGLPSDYVNDVVSATTVTGIASVDSVAERAQTWRERRRCLVADAGAVAPHQPDLSRAGAVCACQGAAAHPHSQPHRL